MVDIKNYHINKSSGSNWWLEKHLRMSNDNTCWKYTHFTSAPLIILSLEATVVFIEIDNVIEKTK